MILNKLVVGGPQLEVPDHKSLGKYVIDKWRHYAKQDKVTLINGNTNEEVTHRQLLEKAVGIATGLKNIGIHKGDVVALCSENCSNYIAAGIGILCAGATVTTLNVKYTRDEITHVLDLSKPRVVFCSKSAVATKLEIIREASCVERIIAMEDTSDVAVDVMTLDDLMVKGCDVDSYEPESVDGANDIAFLLYSSGTTGLVKGVMLTHLNALYASFIYNHGSEDSPTILTITPWYHVYGLITTIQYTSSGNLVVFMPEFNPEIFLKLIEKYKITEVIAVPPIVVVLAKSSLTYKYDLSSVKLVWCAAAPLSGSTIKQALKNLPNCKRILQGYGMTETSLFVLKEPETRPGRPGSCGQPLPGVQVKVVNDITNECLGPHEQGEICLKSPTVMKGYINNEKVTKAMFDEDGFIKTGDIGYYDEDGYFYVVDRIKEIIKYKGQQVAPAAVESIINMHSGVAECGVVGKPDELAGELPTAFVVPKPGANLTEEEILEFTASKLSPMSRLRGGVIFIKEIPRNGSGKILRRILRDQLKTYENGTNII